MATLYVENVPEPIYKALRQRARKNRKSIAAEVIELLEQNVPTAEELKARREFARRIKELSSHETLSPGPFPSAEEMIREDRER
jgi:plasmid stability protein